MDTIDLSALVRPTATDDPLRFTLDVPDGLQQGRGAWGGVATGAMVAAAQLVDPRPEMAVRTLSAQLVAPVLVGRMHLVVEELRRGSATNTLEVRCRDDEGALLAHGVVVLGAPRTGEAMPDGALWLAVAQPSELAAGPEAVPEVVHGTTTRSGVHRTPGDAPDLRDPVLGSGHRRDVWMGTPTRPSGAGRCLGRDRPRGRMVGVCDGPPGPAPSGRDRRLHPRLPQRPLVP